MNPSPDKRPWKKGLANIATVGIILAILSVTMCVIIVIIKLELILF